MKSIFILFITSLILPNFESNTYNLQIKELLTQDVCSIGIFVLDAELNIPMKDKVNSDKFFPVFLRNSKGSQGYTACFLLHYPETTAAKVGCIIPGYEEAVYQILPFTQTGSYTLYGHTINVLPYAIKTPFVMKAGLELYYFSPIYEIKLNFVKADETINLELYYFTQTSDTYSIIGFDNVGLACTVSGGNKLLCPVIAKNLVQERKHIYTPNLIDTNGKVKKNYFVNPVEITLEYIEE
jgi:hypothetical protein